MRVYVESNFVLELVLEQEQHRACEGILSLAESGNRNRKDFDSDVKMCLAEAGCELLWSFEDGLERVRHLLAKA